MTGAIVAEQEARHAEADNRSADEAARLAALHSYGIVGTPPEPSFDAAARFAAELCACEIAVVSFHDRDRQWFKARVGTEHVEAPRSDSFFGKVSDPERLLIVTDAHADPRFRDNPFVSGPEALRFYAGQPLVDRDGFRLGVLCVMDRAPRPAGLTALQQRALETVAEQIVTQLELRREVGQRAAAEAEAAEARDRLALALDSAGEGHWDWNVATGQVWYSDQWYRILDLEPGTLRPHVTSWIARAHPDDLPGVWAAWQAHLSGAQPRMELPVRMRTPSGAMRWVLVRGKVVERTANGAPLRAAGILGDIDGRQFMTQLEQVLRATPDEIGRIAAASDRLRAHLGIAQVALGELDAEGAQLVVHRDSHGDDLPSSVGGWPLARLGADLILRLRAGQTVACSTDVERRAFSVAGSPPAAVLLAPIIVESQLAGVLIVQHHRPRSWSSHEHRLALLSAQILWASIERLRSDERYRLVVKATREAVWDHDLITNRISWNESVFDLFGYPRDSMGSDGDWWESRIHPDDRDRVVASLAAAIATSEAWSDEYRFRRADGSYAQVIDRGTIVRDSDRRPLRAIGAMLDVSARREAEAQLHAAQADLMRVSRLTAMGAVASTLAHELNQPLTGATNFLSLVRVRLAAATGVPEDVPQALSKAAAEIVRAGEIVRRIRRFATTGQLSCRTEKLADILEQAWDSVAPLPVARGCRRRIEIAPGADWVDVDRVQIEQVFSNLLRNALEAMAGAGASPEIDIVARPAGEMTEIIVSDRGPGIDAGVKAHLFEPFRTNKASGLGLGLPLCRTITEAHGGRIWAENRPGGGASFVVSLPHAASRDISG